jgi:hypothetical protein
VQMTYERNRMLKYNKYNINAFTVRVEWTLTHKRPDDVNSLKVKVNLSLCLIT